MPNALDEIRKLTSNSESVGITIIRVPVRQLKELLALAEREPLGEKKMDLFVTSQFMISRNESCRLKAYPDPISGSEPWTIGWGTTGIGIGPDSVWTQEQCDARRDQSIQHVMSSIKIYFPWAIALDVPRRAVMVDMIYNMGMPRFRDFRKFLDRLMANDYVGAAMEIILSKYASQVPRRAAQNIAQLITGIVV